MLDVRGLRLLLLDEPSRLIDHDARLGLQAEIERVHLEHGVTTLHVAHSREPTAAAAR